MAPKLASRGCPVCEHPQRGVIEEALAEGETVRRVAFAYGISRPAMKRHLVFHETLRERRLKRRRTIPPAL